MNYTWFLIKRTIKKGRAYIPAFLLLAGLGLLLVPLEFYGLLLSRRLIDQGFLLQNWGTIRKILFILIILFVIRSIISYITALFSTTVQLRMDQEFQNEIFSHLLHLPMDFFTREPTGRLMSRVLDDAAEFSNIFKYLFGNAFLDPFKLIGLTMLLAYFNLRLCMLMVISSFFSLLVIRWMGNRLHDTSKKAQKQNAEVFSFVEQIFSNIELVKAKITEEEETTRFHHLIDELIQLALKTTKISLIAQPILQVFKYLTLGVVFIYGSWMTSKDVFTIGTLTIFMGSAYLFFNILNSLGKTYGSLRESLARMEVLFRILDKTPEGQAVISCEKPRPSVSALSTLEFKHISFSYNYLPPVLKDVSFTIHRGETLGITGQSGSGKTTLIRLLLRFYEPDTGEIRLNGRLIHHLNLCSLRSSMGIVFQENLILNDTIKNNIAYGNKNIPEDRIIMAAEISHAHHFIKGLPDQYETIIGEGGKSLSGGERQRLSIARAIVADPEILIMDEGTSFLEVEQERSILEKIKETRRERITIIISHRLSAMATSNRILTLDNGRIIESQFKALAEIGSSL
jgi:ABC-type multidrug transport system fused ATPase/permease subunit